MKFHFQNDKMLKVINNFIKTVNINKNYKYEHIYFIYIYVLMDKILSIINVKHLHQDGNK
jgi:hypothetical protein